MSREEPSYVRISEHTHASDSRGDTVRRFTKAALGGLAGCALVLGGTGVASGELLDFLKIHRDSNDVNASTVALDSAKAKITIDKGTDSEGRENTTFAIRVTGIDLTGIDPLMVGQPLGAHLHVGQCVEGDFGNPTATPSTAPGGQALGHYNHDVYYFRKAFPKPGELPSETIAEVSPKTEVWFNLLPDAEGMAYDKTTVPFVPVDSDGVMSVVVHVSFTKPDGSAGTRQACFPLDVSQVFLTPPAE
jgi:hypothetical protein